MTVGEWIEENRRVAKRALCLLREAVEDPHMDADAPRVAHYCVEVAQRLDHLVNRTGFAGGSNF